MYEPFHVLLLRTKNAYDRHLRPQMASLELSPGQPKVLRYLCAHDGCLQRELAAYYGIEPATVSRLLYGMEEQGLIVRRIPRDNKRAAQVFITQQGREKFAQLEQARRRIDQMAFDGLSSSQREQLLQALARVQSNLTQQD